MGPSPTHRFAMDGGPALWYYPDIRYDNFGFRLALDLE